MNETIKMRGRLLLFDVVDGLGYMVPKDCEISWIENVPVVYQFELHNPASVLGNATIFKDEKGLICNVNITNSLMNRDLLRKIFNNELPIGGYYKKK